MARYLRGLARIGRLALFDAIGSGLSDPLPEYEIGDDAQPIGLGVVEHNDHSLIGSDHIDHLIESANCADAVAGLGQGIAQTTRKLLGRKHEDSAGSRIDHPFVPLRSTHRSTA